MCRKYFFILLQRPFLPCLLAFITPPSTPHIFTSLWHQFKILLVWSFLVFFNSQGYNWHVGVCNVLVGLHHFLPIKVLKISAKHIETHSGQIWCDIDQSISHNVVGATAHNITEIFFLQCLMLFVLWTWNIPEYK